MAGPGRNIRRVAGPNCQFDSQSVARTESSREKQLRSVRRRPTLWASERRRRRSRAGYVFGVRQGGVDGRGSALQGVRSLGSPRRQVQDGGSPGAPRLRRTRSTLPQPPARSSLPSLPARSAAREGVDSSPAPRLLQVRHLLFGVDARSSSPLAAAVVRSGHDRPLR